MKHLAMVRIDDRSYGFKVVAFVFEGEGTINEAQVFAAGRWSIFFGSFSEKRTMTKRIPHAEVIQIATVDSHVELEYQE